MKDIKVGVIGGGRGLGLLLGAILPQGELVTAVCDLYIDRAEKCAEVVKEFQKEAPAVYTDYRDMIGDPNVNVIVIATSWEDHVRIAVDAMKAGKVVAMEVGGAYTLEQCWDLVKTYEETKTPFMFLENCCYGQRELMALNMAQLGVFGEIVHCSGGYQHDLRDEISFGMENRHYRLRNYLVRNCDNYPTHDLGPIAKVLEINHGNRMLTLTSMASKAAGLHEYILQNKSDDEVLKNAQFAQGDVVTTIIKCARGETIVLTLDTTLPRYYSRGFTVRGTKGMYEEVTDSVFLDTEENKAHHADWRKWASGNADAFAKEYDHPIWKEYEKNKHKDDHGGADWIEFEQFFKALRKDEPMPIDVYDAASWMSITVLSEMSIAKGGAVVDIPDFTSGRWHRNGI